MEKATGAGFTAATDASKPTKASSKGGSPSQDHFLDIQQELSAYTPAARAFATKFSNEETRATINGALRDRERKVPELAKRRKISSERINEALDILAIIRRL